jgi:TAT (twin-arginine translocation) pathway-exported protein
MARKLFPKASASAGRRSVESTRRDFLKGATGAAAAMISAPLDKGQSSALLPTIALGPQRVTRLIAGSNPVYGYSHFNRLFDQHMLEWFSDERIVQFLLDCEKAGINTWQASYNTRMAEQFPKIRAAGCAIQWICLAASWHLDESFPRTPEGIEEGTLKCAESAAKWKPIGISHHGSATDQLWRAGKLDLIKTFVDKVHDLGLLAGISTHNPAILEALEAKGWPNDFYMTSFYYQTRRPEEFQKEFGTVPVGETYLATDPARMCKVIRKVQKPCLVYKILAAGRKCGSPGEVRGAFEFAFKNIKPTDAAIVGIYPRYSDQIAENSRLVRKICAG